MDPAREPGPFDCRCVNRTRRYAFCDRRATQEDMLCDTCRTGCNGWAYLAAEDLSLHLNVRDWSLGLDDEEDG